MARRVIAAIAALLLAGIGVWLVLAYANSADKRALQGMEVREIYVATQTIAAGTASDGLLDLVELQEIPEAFLVNGAVERLEDLEGQVATATIAKGEQLQAARFSSPEELRREGQFVLPEAAADLHQVTVALEKPRALGGDVAAGDTVGVFMSFEMKGDTGLVLSADGSVRRADPGAEAESPEAAGSSTISTTHLELHKVLVARVEGGYVAPATGASGAADDEEQAQDTVNVTLALEAPEAEQLVFAMEYGKVWLSLEPESAGEDGTGVVVMTIPTEARNVFQ